MKTLEIYQEGLHVLLTLKVQNPELLTNYYAYLVIPKNKYNDLIFNILLSNFA